MNRHERRVARAVNDSYIRDLGKLIHGRDHARDGIAICEAAIEADRAAGIMSTGTAARLQRMQRDLDAFEVALDIARAEAAVHDAEISADALAAAIIQHLAEIGLERF